MDWRFINTLRVVMLMLQRLAVTNEQWKAPALQAHYFNREVQETRAVFVTQSSISRSMPRPFHRITNSVVVRLLTCVLSLPTPQLSQALETAAKNGTNVSLHGACHASLSRLIFFIIICRIVLSLSFSYF